MYVTWNLSKKYLHVTHDSPEHSDRQDQKKDFIFPIKECAAFKTLPNSNSLAPGYVP